MRGPAHRPPATDDGALTAPGFTVFDLTAGYRLRRFDLALDVENLFDAKNQAAAFDTISRLRTDPGVGAPIPPGFTCGSNARLVGASPNRFQGCEGLDFTPAYPFTMRFTATLFLD